MQRSPPLHCCGHAHLAAAFRALHLQTLASKKSRESWRSSNRARNRKRRRRKAVTKKRKKREIDDRKWLFCTVGGPMSAHFLGPAQFNGGHFVGLGEWDYAGTDEWRQRRVHDVGQCLPRRLRQPDHHDCVAINS